MLAIRHAKVTDKHALAPLPGTDYPKSISPYDIIAGITVFGCFATIILGKATDVVVAILVTVITYYFGRSVVTPIEHHHQRSEERQK
jgi:hypothetical protein